MKERNGILIGLGLWMLFLFIMWICISSCTSKHLKKNISKVDSSVSTSHTYNRTTTIEEKGKDSISNPTPPVSTEFDGTDTSERIISTELYDLVLKGGKTGRVKLTPKKVKVPVAISKKTTIQENGNTYQNTQVKKEIKQTDKKVNTSGLWGVWVSLALLIIAYWLYKRIYR